MLADLVLYDRRAKLFCICAQLQLVGAGSSSHVRGSTHGCSAFWVRFGTLGGTRIVDGYTVCVQYSVHANKRSGFRISLLRHKMLVRYRSPSPRVEAITGWCWAGVVQRGRSRETRATRLLQCCYHFCPLNLHIFPSRLGPYKQLCRPENTSVTAHLDAKRENEYLERHFIVMPSFEPFH